MDDKKEAALEVILAALSVRGDDVDGEFDELNAGLVSSMLDKIAVDLNIDPGFREALKPKTEPFKIGWIDVAGFLCHEPLRRRQRP